MSETRKPPLDYLVTPRSPDELLRFTLAGIAISPRTRLVPGILLAEAPLPIRRSVVSHYCIELLDKASKEVVADTGFSIDRSSLLVRLSPKGRKRETLSHGAVRRFMHDNLKGPDFRHILMEQTISIAKSLRLQNISGTSASLTFGTEHPTDAQLAATDNLYRDYAFTLSDAGLWILKLPSFDTIE